MASLMDKRTGRATAAALQHGIVENNPALQQAYAPTIGAQPSLLFSGLDELATLAAALATGPPIPLPSDMGRPGTAAATKTVVWRAPLPKAMRKYDLSALPDENAPIVGAHFQASQYSDLYRSIHHHVQLLAQTTAMAAATGDAESASAGARLLLEMEAFVANQTNSRKASGIPAYVSACLGIDTGEGLEEDEEPANPFDPGHSGLASGSRYPSRMWTPQNPGNIYTVADVSVLRAAPRMLELLPGVVGNEEAATGAPGLAPSSEVENRLPAHATESEQQVKKRKRKPATEHPIWSTLPADISLAVVPVRRFFDPGMEPMPPNFIATSQMLFTPAEDALLAWGIRKHLYAWPKIAAELLPTKGEKIIFNRKKNRCSSAAPDNIVKEVVALITGELTLAEELLLLQALEFYGKQTKKWEIICREHLPHRHPQVLSMLWSMRQKKIAAAVHGAGATGNVRIDAATVTAAAAAMPRANQGLVMNIDTGGGGGGGASVGVGATAAAATAAVADQMTLSEMIAQQQQYTVTQQMAAAAIGAGLLPQPRGNLNGAAAAAAPPSMQPPPQQQQQHQQQQQISGSAAAAAEAAVTASGLAPPRLVEWQQAPGEEEISELPPREAPPRNDASQIFDKLTGKVPGADAMPAVPAERHWSKDEERAVLQATATNGGVLGEDKLQEFMTTMKRSREELIALSEVLLKRLTELQRKK